MSDYPVPSYAANIWVVGDTLYLGFPPLGDGTQGHSVPFPATDKGMALAINILRERGQGKVRLSESGSMTKWQVEKQLAHDKKYNSLLKALSDDKAKKDKAAEELLADLGLL